MLEALSGYLVLGQKMLMGDREAAGPWNFGPELGGNQTVLDILNKLKRVWVDIKWYETGIPQPYEANFLLFR